MVMVKGHIMCFCLCIVSVSRYSLSTFTAMLKLLFAIFLKFVSFAYHIFLEAKS